jgi:hypothetical protein
MNPGLQVISESKEAEKDNSVWKIILLAVLGTVASVASISGFNRLVLGWNALYFWPTLAAFFLFLVLTVLQVFFVKSGWKFAFIAFFESFVPLAFFSDKLYPQPDFILLAGAVLAFVFLFSAMSRGRRLIKDNVRVNFFGTTRTFLSHAALGFFFLFTILLYLNYFNWGNFDINLGRMMSDGALASSEPITKIVTPGISLNGTADEFFRSLAESQLRSSDAKFKSSVGQNIENQFRYLSDKDQEKIVSQFAAQLETVFKERFGDFSPGEKVSDIAFSIVSAYASKINESSPWLIPAGVCILFFLLVKGTFALIYWLISFIAFLIFKTLIAFDFAHIASEERNREFVML